MESQITGRRKAARRAGGSIAAENTASRRGFYNFAGQATG
jgi:hypothetical protein